MCNKYTIISIILSFAATTSHAGDPYTKENLSRKSSVDSTRERPITVTDADKKKPRISSSYDSQNPNINDAVWQERRRKILLEREMREKAARYLADAQEAVQRHQEAMQKHANQRVLRSMTNNF